MFSHLKWTTFPEE